MSTRSVVDLPPDKRRLLFEAATTEFALHDFETASLNRIIAACGMSKSSFYYYFDDKADLYSVLIREASAQLAADLSIPNPESFTDFWPQIEAIFERSLGILERNPWTLALGKLFYRAPDAGTAGVYASVRQWVESALRRGQHLGAIRTDVPFSLLAVSVFALLEALDRWSVENFEALTPGQAHGVAAAQADFLRRMLSPDKSG